MIPKNVMTRDGQAAKCPGCGKAAFIPSIGMTSRYCYQCATGGRMSHREWHIGEGKPDPGLAAFQREQEAVQQPQKQQQEKRSYGRFR